MTWPAPRTCSAPTGSSPWPVRLPGWASTSPAGTAPSLWGPAEPRDLVRRTFVTLAAAEAAGVARWCLETAVDYAKVREQFGQKIGAFQAIKHLCAEMLETSEAVTAAAWDAASAAFGDDDQWAYAADVAEVTCFDGAVAVAKSCIQVLGGIGFTYEHDAHLYLRRALALRAQAGDADAAALRLTERSVNGIRRLVDVDLQGRDEAVRPEVREVAERIGALIEDERRGRTGRGRLPDAALAGAVRPRCRRRHPDRHRRGAGQGRGHQARHRDRGLGAADDRRARQRRAARAVSASVAAGRAGVVPAVLRAGVRLRPGLPAHQGRARRRRLEAAPARRCGPRSPSAPTGASASRAPTPTHPSTRASRTSSST